MHNHSKHGTEWPFVHNYSKHGTEWPFVLLHSFLTITNNAWHHPSCSIALHHPTTITNKGARECTNNDRKSRQGNAIKQLNPGKGAQLNNQSPAREIINKRANIPAREQFDNSFSFFHFASYLTLPPEPMLQRGSIISYTFMLYNILEPMLQECTNHNSSSNSSHHMKFINLTRKRYYKIRINTNKTHGHARFRCIDTRHHAYTPYSTISK